MRVLLALALLFLALFLRAQGIFRLNTPQPQSFKFEMVNNAILVPVVINGKELTFLLDSGVKETLLFVWTENNDYLLNQNKIKLRGLGLGDDIDAMLSTDNVIHVGHVATDTAHAIYVIQATDLDIASDIGTAINGILGAKFFNSFPIAIDYIKSRITLFPPGYDYQRRTRRHQVTDLTIDNERAYIQAQVHFDKQTIKGLFLLDLGNTSPLLVFPNVVPQLDISSPYIYEYLGRGLNGPVHGKRNRARRLQVGDYELNHPIVSYPDPETISEDRLTPGRVGSIGNQVLQRFHLLFDFANNRLYWKKNRHYRKSFLLNMAGMNVRHEGLIWIRELVRVKPEKKENIFLRPGLKDNTIRFADENIQYRYVLKPQYKVAGIRASAPAANAGVQVGDIIIKINGVSASNLSLENIMNRLQDKPDKEISLQLQRGSQVLHIRFLLEDPLPY